MLILFLSTSCYPLPPSLSMFLDRFASFFHPTRGFEMYLIQIWTQISKFSKILSFNFLILTFSLTSMFLDRFASFFHQTRVSLSLSLSHSLCLSCSLTDLLHFFTELGVLKDTFSKSELKFQNFSKFWILISNFDLFPNFHVPWPICFIFSPN